MENNIILITQNAEIKAMEFIEAVKSMEVNSPETNEFSADFLKTVVKYTKDLEAQQKFELEPVKKQAEEIKNAFAKPLELLKNADMSVRAKMNAYAQQVYQEKLEREREEQRVLKEKEAKRLADLEAAAKNHAPESKQSIEDNISEQFDQLLATPVIEKTTMKGTASSSVSIVWDFEITNELEIPREYLSVDTTKIRSAIRSGERKIPGLKIEQKAQVRVK